MKMMKHLMLRGIVVSVLALVACLLVLVSSAEAGLRAYWAMNDDPNGLVASDSSGLGNDGLLVADTVSGDSEDPLPGPTTPPEWITRPGGGGALLFSTGTDNYNNVSVAQSPSLEYLGPAFSFAMWIRQDSRDLTPGGGAGYPRVLSTPNYEIELGIPSWEYDYLWGYEGGPFETDIGPTYISRGGSLGEWYHMAVTYDGVDLKKYLNGELVDTKNDPGVLLGDSWGGSFNGSALKLGSQTYPNKDWFIGALDDVAIWGNAYLDETAVVNLYNGTDTPGTVAFVQVPEPTTSLLVIAGGMCAFAVGRRRTRR